MKRLFLTLAALAVVIATENRSHAGFIFGSQAFSSTATISTPNNNNINDTFFTFGNFVTLTGIANQTGDYVGVVSSFLSTIDTTDTVGSLAFGSATYGTFTPDTELVNTLIPGVSRTISLHGTFAPGIAFFPPGFDPTPGILTITINTAKVGNTQVLSASATLATAAEVPEPSTMVLLATGFGTVGLTLLRRRRGQTRTAAG